MKKEILLFFLLLLSLGVFAQKFRKFTPDKQAYLQQVQDLLQETKVDKKDVLEPLMLDFSNIWTTNAVSDSVAAVVYQTSDLFLKKRVMGFQPWHDYLESIVHIVSNEDEKLLMPWLHSVQKLINDKPASFTEDYLHTSYLTFFKNTFFDDGRVRWKAFNGDYKFDYQGEPVFIFDNVDIWGFYKNDSTEIEATQGVFYPLQYLFKGKGGTTYFTRAGLSEDSASVDLANYEINMRKTDFEADSAKLNTVIFLKEPLMGRFEEKLTGQSGRGATFPRFFSYRKDITIKDIVPGADYLGGFSMIGSKFFGGGTEGAKAALQFNYEGKKIISAKADRFLLRLDKIESEDVELTVYLKDDSIYHPKVTLRYLPDQKTLNIIREDQGLGQTPFTDTYHNVDIKMDLITWKMDEPQMFISNMNLGAETPVIFESKNYYRGSRFAAIAGLDNQNPLFRLAKMTEFYGTRTIPLSDVASYLRMDEQNAHIFMMQMNVYGFVSYNLTTHVATIKQKVFDYINDFHKLRDYDVIRFVSNLSQGSNARLSLLNDDLEIEGVEGVALSDSQKVGLYPAGQKIIVHEDLNFDFDGKITAGRFTYWGKQFKFNYDQFRINMPTVDSMRFKVESFTANALGQRELKNVKTVLQNLHGELLIDDPNNKSGQKQFSQYPIFKSGRDSYVYYDKKEIFNGVYNRNEFYVTLEPFEIDSLDNITTQGLKFAGTFTSAGIFPDLQQTLSVQKDYSLGFTTETPPEGLSAYGKGKFTATLHLSNEGLRGNGDIDYLNSKASSKEFFFFPDSTNGLADNYEITAQQAGPETPHVIGNSVQLHWEPKNNVLYTTSSKEHPFDMYDDIGMKGTGTLAHSPSGLHGSGLMEFLNAETRSQDYVFQNRKFSSKKLAFRVRVNPAAEWGFGLENANGSIDFDKQKGDFYLNDPADYFSFPANKYICYMDFARWDIPQKAIDVQKRGSQASSKMISVKREQDSLQFVADHTKFYLENSLLESFKVPNINVADASIFPDTGYVAIEADAKMRTLNNAAITANRTTKYHEFYGGVINIKSRNFYSGLADYEYVDKDGTPWPIRFNDIHVDTSLTTVGSAQIKQEDNFYMSPYFGYYGNVKLQADRKALEFRGFTHIIANCPSISTDWFEFHSIIDPSNIMIDLPEIDPNDKTKILANGVYLAADTIGGYAAFLSKNVSPADKQMFFANGELLYDEKIGSYIITTKERLQDKDVKANYLALNSTSCTLKGEGKMSIGDQRSQMDVESWGDIDYNLNNDNMTMDLALALNFFFSDDILKEMAASINKETLLEATDLSRPAFKTALNFEVKPKERDKFNQDVANYGAPEELPDELQSTIFFSQLTLKWTPEAVSFLSDGKIGIGSLGKYMVNKKVKGIVEIQRKRRGDEIYIYLSPDRSTEYYFEYKRNILSVYSNDEALMDIIKNLDIKKRRKEEKGMPPFTYTIGTKGKMLRFLQMMDKFE